MSYITGPIHTFTWYPIYDFIPARPDWRLIVEHEDGSNSVLPLPGWLRITSSLVVPARLAPDGTIRAAADTTVFGPYEAAHFDVSAPSPQDLILATARRLGIHDGN